MSPGDVVILVAKYVFRTQLQVVLIRYRLDILREPVSSQSLSQLTHHDLAAREDPVPKAAM